MSEWVKVVQSCPSLCNPVDYTVHRILQARILEWVAFPFSRGSSQSRDRTQVSRIAGRFFTSWVIKEERSNKEVDTLPCLLAANLHGIFPDEVRNGDLTSYFSLHLSFWNFEWNFSMLQASNELSNFSPFIFLFFKPLTTILFISSSLIQRKAEWNLLNKGWQESKHLLIAIQFPDIPVFAQDYAIMCK